MEITLHRHYHSCQIRKIVQYTSWFGSEKIIDNKT